VTRNYEAVHPSVTDTRSHPEWPYNIRPSWQNKDK